MAAEVIGRNPASLSTDDEGNREYTVLFKVSSDVNDGPATVRKAAGLPIIGAIWDYGDDLDVWAFRTPFETIVPIRAEEQTKLWHVTCKFKTQAAGEEKRCSTTEVENPLLEPPTISGSFINDFEIISQDINGDEITTSTFETVELERQNNRPSVAIGQNVSNLQLELMTSMVNKANDAPLWGMQAGEVRLNNVSWQKLYYGTCFVYYSRFLEFEVKEGGFNSGPIPNESSKYIVGYWEPDVTPGNFVVIGPNHGVGDPRSYIRAVDAQGNPTRYWIDPATGKPSDTPQFLAAKEITEKVNFFPLGIPAVLN